MIPIRSYFSPRAMYVQCTSNFVYKHISSLFKRYYVNGYLTDDNHRSYCVLDSLQVTVVAQMLCHNNKNIFRNLMSNSRSLT